MSTYLIGDVHGCFNELMALLAQVSFNPTHDRLWFTGDLVARGPASLDVLRYMYALGSSAQTVLGNHDLYLLAIYAGISRNHPKYRLNDLFNAPDLDTLIKWLRHQPMILVDSDLKLVMTHAGITPQWDLATAQMCAREVETILTSDSYSLFLDAIYGDMPNHWSPELRGFPRLCFSTNVFTSMRYCFSGGQLDMICKDAPPQASSLLKPWFNLPSPVVEGNAETPGYAIAFGHWASLKGQGTPDNIYPLDTGCCWGGKLTLLRWEDKQTFTQPSLPQDMTSVEAE
ncbi:MAG: bis(5'-nucleosyl)-tetraphosphatase (symmetrical) ApaH [Candidatus Malihini olakiniferum]